MGKPRISLITLIVAVNVAGVLVWANLRETPKDLNHAMSMRSGSESTPYVQGWPLAAYEFPVWNSYHDLSSTLNRGPGKWDRNAALVDGLVAVGLLLIAWFTTRLVGETYRRRTAPQESAT